MKIRASLCGLVACGLLLGALGGCGGGKQQYEKMPEEKLAAHLQAQVVQDWKSSGDSVVDTAGTVIVSDAKASILKVNELGKQLEGNEIINKFGRAVEAEATAKGAKTPQEYEAIKTSMRGGFTAEELKQLDAFVASQKAAVAEEKVRQEKILNAIVKLVADIAVKANHGKEGLVAGLLSSGGALIESKSALDKVSDQMNAAKVLLSRYEGKLTMIPEAAAANVKRAQEGK
jgi:hypothetical protein